MPKPLGKLKQSGDIHLPDVEQDLPLQEAAPEGASWTGERTETRRPAAGLRRAGTLSSEERPESAASTGQGDEERPARGGKTQAARTADGERPARRRA